MDILLTNDDGIRSHGLRALYHALSAKDHTVTVVAPMEQQSAVGHALTVFQPVRAKVYDDGSYHGLGIYGTPTDCMKLALGTLCQKRPDLVVSGINLGANVGPDILYSGTVAAATEGALEGIPAIAVSMDDFRPVDVSPQAKHLTKLLDALDLTLIPKQRVLNINYPSCALERCKGMRLCPQTSAVWKNTYHERKDPRGDSYWWLEGEIPKEDIEEGSDRNLLSLGYITITPLSLAFTDYPTLEILKDAPFFASVSFD